MLSRLRFALLLPITALIACGSSTPTITSLTGTASTGDYVITVAAGTAQASIFTGALTVAGTSVTGAFRYSNIPGACVPGDQDIPFTGVISNGTLTLTSASFANSIATLKLALPFGNNTSSQQVSTGTAVITGGTCALASTTANGQYIPNFAGSYNGTLTGPVTGTASVTLTQSGPYPGDSQFLATAAITFTSSENSACNFSVPSTAALTGVVSGAKLQAADDPTFSLTANAGSPPTEFSISYVGPGNTGTACSGTYSGSLSQ